MESLGREKLGHRDKRGVISAHMIVINQLKRTGFLNLQQGGGDNSFRKITEENIVQQLSAMSD